MDGTKQGNILFDFDGVMVNTFDACFRLTKKRYPAITEDGYRARFEGNIYNVYRHDTKENADFFSDYHAELINHSIDEMVAGAIRTLSTEFELFIVSSSATNAIRSYLQMHKLDQVFAEILGFDVEPSKVVKIKSILHDYQIRPEHSMFVTDTLGDILEARAASVQTVAVTWGFHPLATLQKGDPYAIVNSPDELLHQLYGYFKKPL